ncbi:MAG: SH3 domain-containing protein [Clostridia bacterium]|nr:SH3 domain-containing protein [Clostridia bacterium]
MKRLISALMAMCILFACLGTLAQAAETYPFTGYVTTDKVYFRSGPSTQSASYGQLSRGTSVRVTGEKGGFYAVTYQSRSGYILKSLVTRNFIPPVGDGTAYISKDKVYFRKAASQDSAFYCQLDLGTKVTVTGETGNYYAVKYQKDAGFIRKDCLSFTKVQGGAAANTPAPAVYGRRTGYISQVNVNFRQSPSADSASFAQLALGTQVTVTGENGNYYSVTYGGRNGFIRKDCLSFTAVTPAAGAVTPAAYGRRTGYISQQNVYFRKTASAGEYWSQLAMGTQVTVTGETGNYYNVTYAGKNGFIRKDCLSFTAVTAAPTAYARRTGYISQPNVYFRKTASAGDYWNQLALGTQVTVTGETGDYYNVTYAGKNGYIRKDCLGFNAVTAAPTAYARRTGYISQPNVYFRKTASAGDFWTQLALGTQVTVTGETGDYYNVTYGGMNGFIRKDCLRFTAVTAAPTVYPRRTGYISQPNVYFRKTASAGDFWTQLALGTQVTVTGETGDYYNVTYGGMNGFIRRDCLDFNAVTAAPTAYARRTGYISQPNVYFRKTASDGDFWTQLALSTQVTVAGETGNYYYVIWGGMNGFIRKDCLSFAQVTPAPTQYAARDGYICKDNVNFRQMPSADSASHFQMALGTKVTVTGENGDYYQVSYSGLNGFIRKDCLSFAQVTPGTIITPVPTATPYSVQDGYISQDNVYFRKTPSAGEYWSQLPLGTKVTVTGQNGNYFSVIYGGMNGFIRKDCLSFARVTPKATKAPTAAPTSYGYKTAYISEVNVYFRKAASTSSDSYCQLALGTKVTVIGEAGRFYQVQCDGNTGFIMKNCLSFTQVTPKASPVTPAPTEYAPRDGYISQESVYFRKEASQSSDSYTQLSRGTQVKVIGESGNFYKVYYSGYTGYIRKDCLSFTQVTPQASVTTPPPSSSYVTEDLDWFGKGKGLFGSGDSLQVKDCKTGYIWTCRVLYGSNHLDLEPMTAADTAVMTSAYGGNITYVRRPVLVKYNGHVYAGSIYGVPHGDQTIIDNNFDGQFCIHFTGSMTHGTDRVDADHQACVREAMGYTW